MKSHYGATAVQKRGPEIPKKRAEIFTVSTIGLHPDRRVSPRTWGYFFDRKEAIDGLMAYCDTEAGYYTHAIIECFKPGIYAMAHTELWFVHDGKWKPCEKPESEKQIINYGIG